MVSRISKTQKIFLAIFAFFVLLIMVRFFSGLSFSEFNLEFLEIGKATLYPNKPVFQTFTAEKDNLNQIDVAIRNFQRWPSNNKIIFELRDAQCQKVIATDELGRFSFDYTVFTPFTFHGYSDLSGTAGKTYCAALTFVPGNLASQNAQNFPSVVYTLADKSFSYTNTGDNGGAGETYAKKRLVLKPAYGSHNFWENIQTLNDRISQYKAGFLKGNYLYTIAISFLVLTIILVVLLVLI